jgi:UDP-glucose 4-epimerase
MVPSLADNGAMSQTILITGAGGFLAGHIAPAFAASGARVIGVGRSDPDRQGRVFDSFHLNNLSDPGLILPLVDRYSPDTIVHLAAPSSVSHSVRAPLADFDGHVMPTARLLESIRVAGARPRILLVSSAAVYGEPSSLPVTEDAPLRPISPYGFHKLHQELLLREAHELYGIPACTARLFSTYGENLRRLAVWDIARRALSGEAAVFGTGEESRDYLYAADVAEAIVTIASRSAFGGEAVNVASGTEVTIRELADEMHTILGTGMRPRFTGEKLSGSPARWRASVDRLNGLGWKAPAWSRGLASTLEWIRGAA